MPRFYETIDGDNVDELNNKSSEPRVVHWKLMLVGTFIYYGFSCGIERIYQPMVKRSHFFLSFFLFRTPFRISFLLET